MSFYRSDRGKRRIPSVASFRSHFRRFRLRYPWVKLFSTWNEANFADAQPTGRYPKRTAQFYRTLRKECAVGRCTVLAADFRSDGSKKSAKWLKTFKRHMGGGTHRWGLVSHPDITRRSTKQTRWFLKNTRGPVWATEAGAVNFFGRGVKPSISRQTKSMRFLMGKYPRVSRRLQRMYIYHWRAGKETGCGTPGCSPSAASAARRTTCSSGRSASGRRSGGRCRSSVVGRRSLALRVGVGRELARAGPARRRRAATERRRRAHRSRLR